MPENPLQTAIALDPALVEQMKTTDAWTFADGALPARFKLLMAMAFDAEHGAIGGVRALAQRAVRAGATREEIAEALRVAYVMCGVGPVYIGSQALADVLK